jgi:hypothetical protein
MKKLSLIAYFILASFYLYAQGWAKRMGGNGDDRSFAMAVDAAGNVYTTGNFEATADFDPGPGTYNLTPASFSDMFISKLDASGNFVWAKNIGAADGYSITLDGSGNIYITGRFEGGGDFDPGAGTSNLSSAGTYDVFVLKLDASGNFVWTRNMGGTSADIARDIAVDASGNVYTTGIFGGTADFDPGAATFNLTSSGGDDIFISKLDAAGNFVWAGSMGGSSQFDRGTSLVLDASGNIYLAGNFEGTADFDPGAGVSNLTATGGTDIFIARLNASGNLLWVKGIGGTADDVANEIKLDASGNLYITGDFGNTVDFDPGAGSFSLSSAGAADIFVLKLDASGNFTWARNMGGTLTDSGLSIDIDLTGNVYTTGVFQGTADFDPDAGISDLTSDAVFDIFISKLDASGNYAWVKRTGGTGSGDRGTSIVVDAASNVLTTGYFDGTADFDPGPGTVSYTSFNGTVDVFVSRLTPLGTLPLKLLDFSLQLANNKVQLNWITASEENTSHFEIEKSSDGRGFSKIGDVQATNRLSTNKYSFTDPEAFNNLAFYRLKMKDVDGKFNYSRTLSIRSGVKGLQLYPNPAKDVLHLQISGAAETVQLQIIDAAGRIIKQQQWKTGTASSITIDIGSLPKGKYFLAVQREFTKELNSFIKE